MSYSETMLVAEQLMLKKGCELLGSPLQELGWTFKFDSAKTRLGACTYEPKIISLSRHWVSLNGCNNDIEDTIRHEIAHAIDYEKRGYSSHDKQWKVEAVLCGAKPNRLGSVKNLVKPLSRFQGFCISCKKAWSFHRIRSDIYCTSCGITIHILDTKKKTIRQRGGIPKPTR